MANNTLGKSMLVGCCTNSRIPKECEKNYKRVEQKCKPTKTKGRGKNAKKVPNNSKGAWKRSYCKGLQFKPPHINNYDPKKLKKEFDKLIDVKKQLENALQSAKDILIEKAEEWAMKTGAKVATKAAVKGWLGPLGWVWTAYDVVSGVMEFSDMMDIVNDMQKDIENLKNLPEKIKQIKKQGVTPATMADAQALIAKVNPCLRARKCILVPFNKTKGKTKGQKDEGCCDGQTGHHVIPIAQFKGSECSGYDKNKAPTVCVEGTSHSRGGSHQALHDALEPGIKKAADADGKMTYKESKENSLKAHEKIFGHCSKECIAAQLDDYHKKVCGQNENFKLRAVSGKSSKVYESSGTKSGAGL